MNRHRRHYPEGGRATMRIMTILGAGLIGLMHPTASHAGPLDFRFSFTGTILPQGGAGTVTGEIFGLTEGTGVAATNVIVTSDPPDIQPPTPPITIFSNISENSFTVTNDSITDASYEAFDSSQFVQLLINVSGKNFLASFITATDGSSVGNKVGFAGATYTLVQPIPEPSSVTLLGTVVGFVALWPLRRRLQQKKKGA